MSSKRKNDKQLSEKYWVPIEYNLVKNVSYRVRIMVPFTHFEKEDPLSNISMEWKLFYKKNNEFNEYDEYKEEGSFKLMRKNALITIGFQYLLIDSFMKFDILSSYIYKDCKFILQCKIQCKEENVVCESCPFLLSSRHVSRRRTRSNNNVSSKEESLSVPDVKSSFLGELNDIFDLDQQQESLLQ